MSNQEAQKHTPAAYDNASVESVIDFAKKQIQLPTKTGRGRQALAGGVTATDKEGWINVIQMVENDNTIDWEGLFHFLSKAGMLDEWSINDAIKNNRAAWEK